MKRVENMFAVVAREYKNEKYQIYYCDEYMALFFSRNEAKDLIECEMPIGENWKVVKVRMEWNDKK